MNRLQSSLEKYGLLLFVGIVPILFFFYPIFLMIRMSFFVDGVFTLSNYVKFFSSRIFFLSLVNSFWISITSTVIMSILGLVIVVFIRNDNRTKRAVRIISSLPLVFSSYIFCIALIYAYGRAGIITHIFSLFGVDFPIYKILYSKSGIVFANVIFYLPYFIIPLFSSFEDIDKNLEEVAESLGSHGFHKFRKVIFPQVLYGFLVGSLVSFLLVFNQVSIVLAMGVGKVYTLSYLLFAQFARFRLEMVNTIATISLVSTFGVSFIVQNILRVVKR